MGYKLCPRCELNYIKDEEEYCDVCKADLNLGPQLMFAVDDDDEDSREKLCPYCKQSYIPISADMCDQCREDRMYQEEKEVDINTDESWRNYLDDEPDDIADEDSEEMLSLNKLQEEESDELFDDEEEEYFEEEETYHEPDDFDESFEDIDMSDFEEDEEDDEEDDDDEDEDDDF